MKLKELVEKYGEYTVPQEFIEKLEKPKPKTVWELKKGDAHYWIGYYSVNEGVSAWANNLADIEAREIGNVFLTHEEAEREAERRRVETLLLKHGGRRYFDGHSHNFHIGLDEYEEHLKAYILMTPTQGTIYFDTSARAEKAIYEIGEERIKKALFEVR